MLKFEGQLTDSNWYALRDVQTQQYIVVTVGDVETYNTLPLGVKTTASHYAYRDTAERTATNYKEVTGYEAEIVLVPKTPYEMAEESLHAWNQVASQGMLSTEQATALLQARAMILLAMK